MAQAYYIGEELKFSIELTAPNFSMDDDDFAIEVKSTSGKKTITGSKGAVTEDIAIFKEGDKWYGIVNTKDFPAGELKVVGTAYVVDTNAPDGIRTQIDMDTLCMLKNPS